MVDMKVLFIFATLFRTGALLLPPPCDDCCSPSMSNMSPCMSQCVDTCLNTCPAIDWGQDIFTQGNLASINAYTVVYNKAIPNNGKLVSVTFYANAVKPLRLGIYEKTAEPCTLTLVKDWTIDASQVTIGTNTIPITTDNQVNTSQYFGFSWFNGPVLISGSAASTFDTCTKSGTTTVRTSNTMFPSRDRMAINIQVEPDQC